jgi:tetratricopeptide (TPR) repeat protein
MARVLGFTIASISAAVILVSCTAPNEFTEGKALVDRAQKAEDPDEAKELCRQALPKLETAADKHLGGAEGLYYLGVARYRTGDTAGAIEAFQESIDMKPDYVWPRYDLGKAYLDTEEADSAIAQLTKATELKPDYTWAWHMLGRAYDMKGETDEAVDAFERAAAAAPTMEYNYIQLGRLYAETGEKEKAVEAYEKYLELGTVPALRTQASEALKKLEPPEPSIRDVTKPDD